MVTRGSYLDLRELNAIYFTSCVILTKLYILSVQFPKLSISSLQ